MRRSPTRLWHAVLVLNAWTFLGCGYSQEEWDQKVRENESYRNQLAARQQAHQKCEADLSDALAEVDSLKSKLNQRGLNIDNLSANLEQQRKALEEYRRRAEQLTRFASASSS
jgi:chemotaxis protein MotB